MLGPSGCGKSTLLRIIAGLETSTSGELYFYDQEMTKINVEDRGIGFVFQNYALFPTMTVAENIAFGMKLKKLPEAEVNERVNELLAMMNLEALKDKKPRYLSGGQQQRVAIARVLAIKPKILLLDEPLTALDAQLKEYLRLELHRLLRDFGITSIYVTHDQMEAMAIADRMAIMNKGVIEQLGTPQEIYRTPASDFVAEFIGKINRLNGAVKENQVDTVIGALPLPADLSGLENDQKVSVFLRPEDLKPAEDSSADSLRFPIRLEQKIFMGSYYLANAKLEGRDFVFELPNYSEKMQGETIEMAIEPEKIIVLP